MDALFFARRTRYQIGMADKPPSLKDFDYFSEREPAVPNLVGNAQAAQSEAMRSRIRRDWFSLVCVTAFGITSISFLSGYRDIARYAFEPSSEPLELGDAAEFTPSQVPHNAYVRLHGITEHRGLRQELVRGLSMSKEKFWYFRLLGSRGTFIEVPPDAERYGTTTEVTVAGRAVDPAKEPLYDSLLKGYSDIFGAEVGRELRIIQVGVVPGTNKGRYVFAVLLLSVIGLANVAALTRVVGGYLRR